MTQMQTPLPLIVGLSGQTITTQEKKFFAAHPPFGFILFSRNIDHRAQVIDLTRGLQDIMGYEPWIFIDQEGGRVARLKSPLVKPSPPMSAFVELYRHHPDNACVALATYAALQAAEFHDLGINANCVPVLDIRFKGAHDIIGDRAFGDNPADIITLADAYVTAVMKNNILPVMKHIPGHGRAMADSHHQLPRIATNLPELQQTDFVPFRHFAKKIPLAMTGHVLYESIDDKPATLSKKTIDEAIRGWIGFDGLLMTDDLSMAALSGDMKTRGRAALQAGCDILLHCNGKMDEMTDLVAAIEDSWDEKKSLPFKKSCQNLTNLFTAKKETFPPTPQPNQDFLENLYQQMTKTLSPYWQAS